MNRLLTAPALALAVLAAAAEPAAAQFPPRVVQPPPGWPYPPSGLTPTPQVPSWRGLIPVYQLRNVQSGENVYTTDANEMATLVQARTHQNRGEAFSVLARPRPGTLPLVRYVRSDGTHFLATSPQPAQAEATLGYVFDRPVPGTVPVITWHDDGRNLDYYSTNPRDTGPARWGFRRADVLGYALP